MVSSGFREFGWRGRWIWWRNRVIGSTRFQQFAARFPLTKPIARRRAHGLFDLVAGFAYSQILAACVQTGLFDLLADSPLDAATIAARLDLPTAGADRLLRGAAALGLVEQLGALWVLGSHGAALRGNPGIAEMIAHHHLLYADLADPIALLRRGGGGGALSSFWHYAESAGCGDDDAVGPYSTLMARSQPVVATQVLRAYSFQSHRRLLDVGGGEGVFLKEVAAHYPNLELALFDLPSVGDRARARFAAANLKVEIFGGDFFNDPLPRDYDLISLVRILHDHDDTAALTLLRNIHHALPVGGRLIIAEPMAGSRGAESVGAYFDFYLLAMGSGRPRSTAEITTMLRDTGFRQTRQLPTSIPLTTSAIIATR